MKETRLATQALLREWLCFKLQSRALVLLLALVQMMGMSLAASAEPLRIAVSLTPLSLPFYVAQT